jgi:hypothetical protein
MKFYLTVLAQCMYAVWSVEGVDALVHRHVLRILCEYLPDAEITTDLSLKSICHRYFDIVGTGRAQQALNSMAALRTMFSTSTLERLQYMHTLLLTSTWRGLCT